MTTRCWIDTRRLLAATLGLAWALASAQTPPDKAATVPARPVASPVASPAASPVASPVSSPVASPAPLPVTLPAASPSRFEPTDKVRADFDVSFPIVI